MNRSHILTHCMTCALAIGIYSALIPLLPVDTVASDTVQESLRRVEFAVEPSAWYSLGEAGFKGDWEGWRWELEYPLNGWMAEIGATSHLPFAIGHRRFGASLTARYAHSIRVNGTSADTDWDSLGTKSDYSEADCEADITMWDVNAALVMRLPQNGRPAALEVGTLVGYGVQRFEFSDSDLHVTLSDGRPTDRHYPGVSSFYRMDLRSVRVGLFADIHTSKGLQCYIEGSYVPYLKASADALWVFRNYPFWQEAEGKGYTANLRTSYTIRSRLSVFIGFRLVSLVADQGAVEGGILDGVPYEDEPWVSEITSKYFGIEVGTALRF